MSSTRSRRRPALRPSPARAVAICLALAAVPAPVLAEDPTVAPLVGAPQLSVGAYDVTKFGYRSLEATQSGVAVSFAADGDLGDDGGWRVKPAAKQPYKTRLVVMRPDDAKTFNGTVIVEWMNVTGGFDVPVEWVNAHRELVRQGYAYVGVTAQKVGVDGGGFTPNPQAPSLKKADPVRYGSLLHPGDAFSYDIFSDVGRILKSRQRSALLGDLTPRRLLAVGESQSAAFMATYVNAVDPLARVYDGYLIHSRPGMVARLDGQGIMEMDAAWRDRAVKLRTDLRVPVIQLITETDLVQLIVMRGFYAARQPDNAHLRTWELAGAAHADNYLFRAGQIDTPDLPIDQLAAAWAPMSMGGPPINNGPQQHYVAQAAIAHLNSWVANGKAPPHGEAIVAQDGRPPLIARDALGIARGGIRSPWIDAPISALVGSDAQTLNTLTGAVRVFDKAALAKLYPGGKPDYLRKFTASLDSSIGAGFILPADRAEILKLADAGFDSALR